MSSGPARCGGRQRHAGVGGSRGWRLGEMTDGSSAPEPRVRSHGHDRARLAVAHDIGLGGPPGGCS